LTLEDAVTLFVRNLGSRFWGDLGKMFSSNWKRYIQEGGLGVASCIAGSDSNGFFFPVGTPEGARLPSLA